MSALWRCLVAKAGLDVSVVDEAITVSVVDDDSDNRVLEAAAGGAGCCAGLGS